MNLLKQVNGVTLVAYLEGKNIAPKTNAEARKLIEKRVQNLRPSDIDRSGRVISSHEQGQSRM